MKHGYILGFTAGLLSLAACNKGGFPGPDRSLYDVVETMTLEASSTEIILDAEALDEVALTLNWTPAREMSDDYIVTYVTYLDIEGNDFSNAVRQVEDDGVFCKQYTTSQLQDLLTQKWHKNYSRAVSMEFKVIAKWDGGEKYVMPEVRTTSFSVRPYRPLTFDADRIFLSGDAVTGTTKKAIGKTPENEYIYAEEVYLKPGKLTIPIEYQGMTSYICPEKVDVDIPDADQVDGKPAGTEAYPATVKELKEGEELPAWNVPSEGYWRVIIDIENKTVRFFSPKNRLEPLTVEFAYENKNPACYILTKTLLDGNYYINSMTGWDSWQGKALPFKASKVDPQIICWQGSAFTVPAEDGAFCIRVARGPSEVDDIRQGEGTNGTDPNKDRTVDFMSRVLAFVPATEPGVPVEADIELTMGEWIPTAAAVSQRKWKPAAGGVKLSRITIDARNNLIRFD